MHDGNVVKIGDIRVGNNWVKEIFTACPICNKSRWIQKRSLNKGKTGKCYHCSVKGHKGMPGKTNPNWTGGRHKDPAGYIRITVTPDSKYYPMASVGNTIHEHRLVMAENLGRCLLKSEQVHHINGIRDDNRLKNLQLVGQLNHSIFNAMCGKCTVRKEVRKLREEVNTLKARLQGNLF